jgi:hypothetical protein
MKIRRMGFVFIVSFCLFAVSCDPWVFSDPEELIKSYYGIYIEYSDFYNDSSNKYSKEKKPETKELYVIDGNVQMNKYFEQGFDRIFYDKRVYLDSLRNLKSDKSRQYDEFLYSMVNVEVQKISEDKQTGRRDTWSALVTTKHIVYDVTRTIDDFSSWFMPGYERVKFNIDDFKKVFKVCKEFSATGTYSRNAAVVVSTEEKHVFELSNVFGRYKIKSIKKQLIDYTIAIVGY